jgi:hypothetical protein
MPHSLRWIVAGCLVLLAQGCAKEAPKYPVRGKVSFKGQPLTEGTVMFVASGTGVTGAGTIQSDGSYELRSGKPGNGMAPGSYRVSVNPPYYDPTTGSPPKFAVKYQDPESSGLKAEVKEGSNTFDFDLVDARTKP